ncbi:glutamate carboxypeptidase [Cupriavidus necator]
MHAIRLAFPLLLLCASLSTRGAEPNQAVLAQSEQYREEALSLLERLVNIDSGSASTSGIESVSSVVVDELKRTDAQIETVSAKPAAGSNVLATWKGTGKARILLMAHLDTVFPDGTASTRPFRISDGRAYGPGVVDNKGGVVLGIYAMKVLKGLDFKQYGQITLLLNTNEETGSKGSRALIEQQAKQHDVVLNLEPGREHDGLTVQRKGSGTLTIEVTGKASHAAGPEKGRNAVTELAHQILELNKLGDPAKLTTLSVTVVKAGTVSNVIPDSATAYGDVRVAVPEEFDRIERDLVRVSGTTLVPDTKVTAKLVRGFPPMPRTPTTDKLAAQAQEIYTQRSVESEMSGGAADASLTAGVGTPTLDGFGMVGAHPHSTEEYADVNLVVPRLYLLSRMLMRLSTQ